MGINKKTLMLFLLLHALLPIDSSRGETITITEQSLERIRFIGGPDKLVCVQSSSPEVGSVVGKRFKKGATIKILNVDAYVAALQAQIKRAKNRTSDHAKPVQVLKERIKALKAARKGCKNSSSSSGSRQSSSLPQASSEGWSAVSVGSSSSALSSEESKASSSASQASSGFSSFSSDYSSSSRSLSASSRSSSLVLEYRTTKTFGGSGYDDGYNQVNDQISAIALDSQGNLFVAGCFMRTVDFDPGPLSDTRTSGNSGANFDIFLTRYNQDGSYAWTVNFSLGGGCAKGITVDRSGDVLIAGYDSASVLLSKYSNNGTLLWTRGLSPWGSGNRAAGVATDAEGNVYVTGFFQGSVDFDPSPATETHTSRGLMDLFLTSYSADGTYRWTKTVGGTGYDRGMAVKVAASGDVYIVGGVEATVDFDPSPGVDSRTGTTGFLTKFNADGSYGWTRTVGSDPVFDAAFDADGNIYVAGKPNHFTSASLSKYAPDGSLYWQKIIQGNGSGSNANARSITISSNGIVYVGGDFYGRLRRT